jgi:arsenate reductase
MKKQTVLFLCTGNSARSQMAEAFLRKLSGDRFEALSAGLDPVGVNPLTIKVMNEVGIDMSVHSSKTVGTYLGKVTAHFVVFVCDRAEKSCPYVWPNALARLSWPFEDPAACRGTDEERLAKFRQVRDQIRDKIQSWLIELGSTTR